MSDPLQHLCNSLDFHSHRRCSEGDLPRVFFDYLTVQAGSAVSARLDASLYRSIFVDYQVVRQAILFYQRVNRKMDSLFSPFTILTTKGCNDLDEPVVINRLSCFSIADLLHITTL